MDKEKQLSSAPGGKWLNRLRKSIGVIVLAMPVVYSINFMTLDISSNLLVQIATALFLGIFASVITMVVIAILAFLLFLIARVVIFILVVTGWISKDTEEHIEDFVQQQFKLD